MIWGLGFNQKTLKPGNIVWPTPGWMQVESMKTELKRASDDSKRLTDKLCRLEEDNRQLEAMVSRLGGQDARKLKAQVRNWHSVHLSTGSLA